MLSVDGGSCTSLLTLDNSAVPCGHSSPSRANETVQIDVQIPNTAERVALRFNLRNAGNDWWWAIDNIKLSQDNTLLFAANFDERFDDLPACGRWRI